MIYCTKCKTEHPEKEFHKMNSKRGYQYHCKAWQRTYQNERYRLRKEAQR